MRRKFQGIDIAETILSKIALVNGDFRQGE